MNKGKSLAVILLILLMLSLTGCVSNSKYEALEREYEVLEREYRGIEEELYMSRLTNKMYKEQSYWCKWLTLDYPRGICQKNATHIAICSGKDFPLCEKHAEEAEKLGYKITPIKKD